MENESETSNIYLFEVTVCTVNGMGNHKMEHGKNKRTTYYYTHHQHNITATRATHREIECRS